MAKGSTNVDVFLRLHNHLTGPAKKAAASMAMLGKQAKKASAAQIAANKKLIASNAGLNKALFLKGGRGGRGGGSAVIGGGGRGRGGSRWARMRIGHGTRGLTTGLMAGGGSHGLMGAAGLGYGAYRSAKAFADYESEMLRVKAVTRATAGEFRSLNKEAMRLGAVTPYTSAQVGDAMGFMAMAGMKTNQILGASEHVMNLAAAGNMELGRSADIVTNVMRGYGIETHNVGKATDVLVETFTSSNTNLEMLGQSFKYAGGTAKAAGFRFSETAALLGMMGDAGIQASMSGTAVRGLVAQLYKLDQTTDKKKLYWLKKYNLQFRDRNGHFKDFAGILKELEKVEPDKQGGAVAALFGLRPMQGIMAALEVGGSSELERRSRILQKSWENGGRAAEVARSRMAGLHGQWMKFTSAVGNLQIVGFDKIGGAATSMNALADATERVRTAIEGLTLGTFMEETFSVEMSWYRLLGGVNSFIKAFWLGMAGVVDGVHSALAEIADLLFNNKFGRLLGLAPDAKKRAETEQSIRNFKDRMGSVHDYLQSGIDERRERQRGDIRAPAYRSRGFGGHAEGILSGPGSSEFIDTQIKARALGQALVEGAVSIKGGGQQGAQEVMLAAQALAAAIRSGVSAVQGAAAAAAALGGSAGDAGAMTD